MTENTEFRYKVQYKFTGESEYVEQWLAKNCSGAFNFVLDKKPKGPNSTGNINLWFENEADRSLFRHMILKGF